MLHANTYFHFDIGIIQLTLLSNLDFLAIKYFPAQSQPHVASHPLEPSCLGQSICILHCIARKLLSGILSGYLRWFPGRWEICWSEKTHFWPLLRIFFTINRHKHKFWFLREMITRIYGRIEIQLCLTLPVSTILHVEQFYPVRLCLKFMWVVLFSFHTSTETDLCTHCIFFN